MESASLPSRAARSFENNAHDCARGHLSFRKPGRAVLRQVFGADSLQPGAAGPAPSPSAFGFLFTASSPTPNGHSIPASIEGIHSRINAIKRTASRFRDEEYCTLKIRAAFPG